MTANQAVGPHCTLGLDALPARLGQWEEVARRALRHTRPRPGVSVADYPNEPELRARLEELIAAERSCCSFLDFTLDEHGDELRVTLRHPEGFTLLPAL